jgi:hypothetical protein
MKTSLLSKKQRKELLQVKKSLLSMKKMLDDAKIEAFNIAGMDGYSEAIIFKGNNVK